MQSNNKRKHEEKNDDDFEPHSKRSRKKEKNTLNFVLTTFNPDKGKVQNWSERQNGKDKKDIKTYYGILPSENKQLLLPTLSNLVKLSKEMEDFLLPTEQEKKSPLIYRLKVAKLFCQGVLEETRSLENIANLTNFDSVNCFECADKNIKLKLRQISFIRPQWEKFLNYFFLADTIAPFLLEPPTQSEFTKKNRTTYLRAMKKNIPSSVQIPNNDTKPVDQTLLVQTMLNNNINPAKETEETPSVFPNTLIIPTSSAPQFLEPIFNPRSERMFSKLTSNPGTLLFTSANLALENEKGLGLPNYKAGQKNTF